MDGLLSVSEARNRLLTAFLPVGKIVVSLAESSGRVLAEEIISRVDLPSFSNSSMDGFAVRTEDVAQAMPNRPAILPVVGDIPAGRMTDRYLESGQAMRIMTGAALPEGAEAVIPVENTDFHTREPGLAAPEEVKIFAPVRAGENIRPRGQDVRSGQSVLAAHRRLRPQDTGFLAMLGIQEVSVFRKPRVAIFSTGDELVPVGEPLQGGEIHDSNAYILAALIELYGGQPIHLGVASDRASDVEACLQHAVKERVDLILSSAGVSVGAFDFVRSVVERQGKLEFWRVNMRPGKPLAFGRYQQAPFAGLPGNPVSAFIGFEVFIRPAILKMTGILDVERPSIRVTLAENIESDGRESYLRAIVTIENGRTLARLTGHQGSGNLHSLVQANALLIVPSGVKSLPVGSEVEAWML